MEWYEPIIVLVLQTLQSLSWETCFDHISTVRFDETWIYLDPLPVMIPFRRNSYAPRVRTRVCFITVVSYG